MILLAGLGNPGEKYEKNRHNVGFMAVEKIAERHGFAPWRSRFQGETAEGRLGTQKCLLLKPSTYMNESGRAVSEAMRFYKLELEDLVVLHDELDLKPGKLKVKTGGGHAGNNGLRSIIQHIGADFRRVRIGIGHPGQKHLVANYVLHDFSKEDENWVAPLLDAVADAAPRLAEGDDPRFMNDVALATGADQRGDKKKSAKQQAEQNDPQNSPSEQDKSKSNSKETNKNTAPKTALGDKLAEFLRAKKTDES